MDHMPPLNADHFDHQDTFPTLAMGNRVLTRTKWLAYPKWFNWGEFNEIICRGTIRFEETRKGE